MSGAELARETACYSARCARECQEVCGPCWDIGGCARHDRYRKDHSVEGPDLGELARLEAAADGALVPLLALHELVRGVEQGPYCAPEELIARARAVAAAAPFLLAQAAAVQRVRELCDVVRRLQPADPDTGDRDVSFFALLEALGADDA